MSTSASPLDATVPRAVAIEQRLVTLFEDELALQVPDADTDLLESGLLDSLALVELLALLEQEFDIRIAIEDLELDHFRSLQAIVSFVVARRRRATA